MLIDQPTSKTNRKVKSAAWAAGMVAPIAGLLAAAIASRVPMFEGQSLHLEVLLTSVLTALATWASGYFTRERS